MVSVSDIRTYKRTLKLEKKIFVFLKPYIKLVNCLLKDRR